VILPYIPIWTVDFIGAILMIVFGFLCLKMIWQLKNRQPDNVIWTYLLWFCLGMAVFAISRSAGHILKQLFILSGNSGLWASIRPFSGAVNTMTFVMVASITLFFERVWKIHQIDLKDKQALEQAHGELLYLNQNLEKLVADRTEALAVSEHKYRRIFENSRDMILVVTNEGYIVDLNPLGCEMLGYTDADITALDLRFQDFFVHQDDWTSVLRSVESQGFVLNAEVELKRIDGSHMQSLVTGSLDRGLRCEEATIHFLIKDIEAIRHMEKQMAQADKLASIGQLSAGIAHEINNPLGIILGYTQLLIRGEDQDTERHEDLRTIEKHVKNCKAIVEDLLNFARSSAPKKERIRINRVIEEVVEFFRHHGDVSGIDIRRVFDPAVPPMLLDEKKIKQVLINFLMNARHAVGDAGIIRLSTRWDSEAGRVLITVADNGYGIDKKNLSRIFDPFFTTKPTGEGTGLGLSVSYGIIINHGGDISVSSKSGKGTVFTIILPVESPAEEAN